ncbi:MAG TPA: metalloregulator ArsR/SmtB family transcription factor [Chloroflexia bacterium]|nr:metalloregulator ArsR/SmtB family transcription factor [Chloroflexia bacterium]
METHKLEFVDPERRRGTRCCGPESGPRLSMEEAKEVSEAMQILGHPIRLQILDMLARNEGQVCVCDIEEDVPVKQPTVSHHLKLLREAGLIDCERHGLWAYYFVKRDALSAMQNLISRQLQVLAPSPLPVA